MARFIGNPCSVCGDVQRNVANGGCVSCSLRRTREWKAERRDQMRAASLAWYEANKERSQQTTADWRSNNKAAITASARQWRHANPIPVRAARHRRRERIKTGQPYTSRQAELILNLQDGCCAYCDEYSNLQIDHVIPLCRGGSNHFSNIQWLCAFHNQSKHHLTDGEYRLKQGFAPVARNLSLVLWSAMFGL